MTRHQLISFPGLWLKVGISGPIIATMMCVEFVFVLLVSDITEARSQTECFAADWDGNSVRKFKSSDSAMKLDSLIQYGVVHFYGLYDDKPNFEEALLAFEKAALSGYPPAQNILGVLYLTGWGIEQPSNDMARSYFEMAAEQKYAPALNNLGSMYWNGWGVQRDQERALEYFAIASQEEYAPAQYKVALSYETRTAEPKYQEAAMKWLEAADGRSYAPASFKLGVDAAKGVGLEKDYGKAAKSFVKAAKVGDPWSQYNLGRMHALGLGVTQSLVNAYAWFYLSEQGGVEDAAVDRGVIMQILDGDQIKEAMGIAMEMQIPQWGELIEVTKINQHSFVPYDLLDLAPELIVSRAKCSGLTGLVEEIPWATTFEWIWNDGK